MISPITHIGSQVMAESALLDKETGRIFWEGGAGGTVAASLSPKLSEWGLARAKSSLLSLILWSCILSVAAAKPIRKRLSLQTIHRTGWFALLWTTLARWSLLKLPEFDTWFIITVLVLYYVEAYHSHTRRYLNNAIPAGQAVQEMMQRLREAEPQVTWKVRCFHYDRRLWAMLLVPQLIWRKLLRRDATFELEDDDSLLSPTMESSWWLTRKVVTNIAQGQYTFQSCLDTTLAGVWKLAPPLTETSKPRFIKIVLSKLLLLGNAKARQDYFRQQADFVTKHGQSDQYAEFSTSIQIDGFVPKLLVIPGKRRFLFRLELFWIFTLLGLTVPYRIWLARHSDVVRVMVTKECYAEALSRRRSTSSSQSIWNDPRSVLGQNNGMVEEEGS